eukprot:176864_1
MALLLLILVGAFHCACGAGVGPSKCTQLFCLSGEPYSGSEGITTRWRMHYVTKRNKPTTGGSSKPIYSDISVKTGDYFIIRNREPDTGPTSTVTRYKPSMGGSGFDWKHNKKDVGSKTAASVSHIFGLSRILYKANDVVVAKKPQCAVWGHTLIASLCIYT